MSLLEAIRNEIKFLAFEGGGGRGAAYIGALKYLTEKDIISFVDCKDMEKIQYNSTSGRKQKPKGIFKRRRLDPSRIQGVSGTSAGAITACLLVAGYDYQELRNKVVLSGVANTFYDDPDPFKCPIINIIHNSPQPITIVNNATGILKRFARVPIEVGIRLDHPLLLNFLEQALKHWMKKAGYFAKKIAKNLYAYLDSFLWDFGLLSGVAIRTFIDKLLSDKFGEENISFERLYSQTNIHLKLAGVCLNTSEQIWFDHVGPWRQMPVADAVRISMSIPGAFKPVAIPYRSQEPDRVNLEDALLFVDGGVLNNLPLHAFDDINIPSSDRALTKVEAIIFGGQARLLKRVLPLNKVLALRLTDPIESQPAFFGNGLSLLGGVINTLMTPAEVNQVRSEEEKKRTIDLDTSGLDTLKFDIDEPTLIDVEKRTFDQTRQWIDRKVLEVIKKRGNRGQNRRG